MNIVTYLIPISILELGTITLPTVQLKKLSIKIINNMPKDTKLVRMELGFRTNQAHSIIHAFNHTPHRFLNQDDR